MKAIEWKVTEKVMGRQKGRRAICLTCGRVAVVGDEHVCAQSGRIPHPSNQTYMVID